MCRYFVYTKYIRYEIQSGGGEPNLQDSVPDIEKLDSKLLTCDFWITVSELENIYQTENGDGFEVYVPACECACVRVWHVWHACVCVVCVCARARACVRVCYSINVYLSNYSCLIKGKVLVQYLKWQCSSNCPDSRSHNYTAGFTSPPNQHMAMPPTSPHTGQFDAHKLILTVGVPRASLSRFPSQLVSL